jgi:hypothetical protein|tara:strand:- start:157 stop:522 length:366 start_codon:yes stop_codon:yes gene_type:complete
MKIKVVNVGLSKKFGEEMQEKLGENVSVDTVTDLDPAHYDFLKEDLNIFNVPHTETRKYIHETPLNVYVNSYSADTEDDPEPLFRLVRDQVLEYQESAEIQKPRGKVIPLGDIPDINFYRA